MTEASEGYFMRRSKNQNLYSDFHGVTINRKWTTAVEGCYSVQAVDAKESGVDLDLFKIEH